MTTIRNLVFSGGGVAGVYAYTEVIKELRKKIPLENIQRVAGVSIGAITALIFALKFTDDEAEKFIAKIKFKDINDRSSLPHRIYNAFMHNYGICKGDVLLEIIKNIFREKKYDPDTTTFAELKAKENIELFITVTHVYLCDGIEESAAVDFSPKKTPDTTIADIVFASASAFPYFPCVRLKQVSDTKYIKTD